MKPSVPLCCCNALLCVCTVLCFVLALGAPGAAASALKVPRTQAEVKRLSVKQEIQLGASAISVANEGAHFGRLDAPSPAKAEP